MFKALLSLNCSRMLIPLLIIATTVAVQAQSPSEPVKPPEAAESSNSVGTSEDAGAQAPPALQPLERDAGFDRYIDRKLLSNAVRKLNASTLTDVALQFLQGEEVLMRQHKSISAEAIAGLAVQIASEKKDTQSLDRLAAAFEKRANSEIAEKIALARQLGEGSRAVDPAQMISVTDTTVESFVLFRNLLAYIDAKKFRGDREALTELQAKIPSQVLLSDSQKQNILQKIEEALETSETTDGSLLAQLEQLSGDTRGGDTYAAIAYSRSTQSTGVYTYAFSKAEAEEGALDACDEFDARIVQWVRNGHIAFAESSNGPVGWAHSTISKQDAESRAINYCAQNGGRGITIAWYLNSRLPFQD